MAAKVAPMMAALSVAAAPVVWFLDRSGKLVLRLMGQRGDGSAQVTEEEVKVLLTEAQEGGVLEVEERAMISGVMRLSDRTSRALMTPRQEVKALPVDLAPDEIAARVVAIGQSRIPVADGSGDVLGVVRLADLYAQAARGESPDLNALMRQVPVI